MRQVLFHWRGVEIYSYPAMLYLGLVFGIIAGNYVANMAGLNSARIFVATLLLIAAALVGARLLFVALHWEIYRREPKRIWHQSEGGAAMYGGLPFSLLASVPLLSALQIPFSTFWDVAAFTILIGMIFTRIGCLFHGCCSGRPTNWRFTLYLPDHRGIWKRRIPSQLLEASWATLLLVGAVVLWSRISFPGGLFLYALAGYGIGRFVLESTREEQDTVRRITVHRLISAALVTLSVTIFMLAWLR